MKNVIVLILFTVFLAIAEDQPEIEISAFEISPDNRWSIFTENDCLIDITSVDGEDQIVLTKKNSTERAIFITFNKKKGFASKVITDKDETEIIYLDSNADGMPEEVVRIRFGKPETMIVEKIFPSYKKVNREAIDNRNGVRP